MKKTLVIVLGLGFLAATLASHAQAVCDTTVTAPSSIQTAVDTVTDVNLDGERVVCLDDSGLGFFQSVVFGSEDSGITLTPEPGDSPVLDGSSLVPADAIRLLTGVSNVTIEGLEITGYGSAACCGPGMGIQAWNDGTSNITVQNNYIHGNTGNAILVGNERPGLHTGWLVQNNRIEGAGFYLLELTNCADCTMMKNDVDGGSFAGIIVQARNTVPGSGLATVDGVSILHNTVANAASYGIYVLSYTGVQTDPFDPVAGASILLSSVNISQNIVSNSGNTGILFWAFNEGATAENGRIVKNTLNCQASKPGIRVLERSASGPFGTVENVKVVNNSFDANCNPQVTDEGEDTKLPRGLGPY